MEKIRKEIQEKQNSYYIIISHGDIREKLVVYSGPWKPVKSRIEPL